MLIVCHLSYRDSEAIVHTKRNTMDPSEQQYSHYATETRMINNRNAKLL